jgi:hypothetical protein
VVWDSGGDSAELKTNPGLNGAATSVGGWAMGILEAWRRVPSLDVTAQSLANSAESCEGDQ